MKKFTQENKARATIELSELIEYAVDTIYTDRIHAITPVIKANLALTRDKMIELLSDYPLLAHINLSLSHDRAIKQIVSLIKTPEDRAPAYALINASRRKALLASILTSKVKLRSVARSTLKGLVEIELQTKLGKKPTLGQLIHKCTLKPNSIIVGIKEQALTQSNEDSFIVDELKLQFISELCELDLLDMKISDHTHMVEVPQIISQHLDDATWLHMHKLSQFVNTKHIFTEPVEYNQKSMILRGSFWYKTPELSDDQITFINTMHSTKYEFTADALDRIKECYLNHLRDDKGNLPDGWREWVPARIAFFKEQIQASYDNGGHYIEGKFDSSLRWYMMAEIGHFQTSSALRSLVKVSNIKNKMKKDMRNNVIQIYSTLMQIQDMAGYVGLVDESLSKQDLRLEIAQQLNSKLDINIFTKDNIKPLFMVWAYNAGKNRILDGVTKTEAQLFGPDVVNITVKGLMALTGAKNDETNRDIIWSAFEETVTELVPVVVILKKVFRRLIKHNPLTQTEWTMPDGAIAQYASPETLQETLFFVSSNGKQHQHTHHRKLIVTDKKSAGLLPRVIHSYDAWMARQIVIRAAVLGIVVVPNHDSFMFDEEHEAIIDQIVTTLFIEMLESTQTRDNKQWLMLGATLHDLNKSQKSLAVRNSANQTITNQMLFDAYGQLTKQDILAGSPMDHEDI